MSKKIVFVLAIVLAASACGVEAGQQVSASAAEPAVVPVLPVGALATDDGPAVTAPPPVDVFVDVPPPTTAVPPAAAADDVLTIVKTVIADSGTTYGGFAFEWVCPGGAPETMVVSGPGSYEIELPTGAACTVTEVFPGGLGEGGRWVVTVNGAECQATAGGLENGDLVTFNNRLWSGPYDRCPAAN